MKKFILLLGLLVFIGGCVSTSSITTLGPDTYTVRGWDTENAIEAGEKKCARQGKKLLVTNLRESTGDSWGAIIFRCLDEDDPEYRRPDYQTTPDNIIEDQRR